MPAVTVADPTALARLTTGTTTTERPVRQIVTAPTGFEGEGFPVHRAFAGVDLADLDPFIHMDEMGEVDYAPGEPKGTSWHPHRGFETVTYMIDGVFEHGDNHGGGGTITDGDTQWMTAGSGILHIEKPPEWLVASGGLFHGIQLWVNLPAAQKFEAPRYQDIRAGQVSLLTTPDAGAVVRLIAGDLVDALRRVARGGTALDPEVVAQLMVRNRADDPLSALTPREREVLAAMAEGRTNVGIANLLSITEGATEKHISNIFGKLQLPDSQNDHRRVLAVLAYLGS